MAQQKKSADAATKSNETNGRRATTNLVASTMKAYLAGAKFFKRPAFLICLSVSQIFYYQRAINGMEGTDHEVYGMDIPSAIEFGFSVDILSVGSINRPDLLEFQERTLTAHSAVRNFFNATEVDDYDPSCYQKVTLEHVEKVSDFCRSRKGWTGRNLLGSGLRPYYGRIKWLAKKKNPAGWLCAQQRPYAGFYKAYMHYQKTKQSLPNFFIIVDDDSYYNMDAFQENHKHLDPSVPTFVAGCVVRLPIHIINFTFPFGGFGVVFSRGTLEYLFHPIICPYLDIGNGTIPMVVNHDNGEAICSQLTKDIAGELKYFEQGMSLVELIYKYVNTPRYRDVDNWKRAQGFCMHSDWVMGYFSNFYNASMHVKDPAYKNVPHARLESYNESFIYSSSTGFCKNECRRGAEICHQQSLEWMEREAKSWRSIKSKNGIRL
mmetsp:Transcript_9844/g.15112  ORF Transcript_9844/g.15112 Transcript_9844/m.15112 type:complete len:434 (-) Transcript_9844:205-1506(-)